MRQTLVLFATAIVIALICFSTLRAQEAASVAAQDISSAPTPAQADPSHYLVVRLTADAFSSLVDKPIDRVSNVNEIILGTPVVGKSRTTGRPQVQLQENPREAGFLVELKGATVSRTQGHSGPVVVHSRTTTHFHAKKYVVFVPGEGFRSGPATTEARTQTVTEGIDVNRRGLVGRITERRASESVAAQRAQCEAIARDKAIRRVNKLFDEYLEGRLAKLNQRVAMVATISALRGKEEPMFTCCSTKEHVLIALTRRQGELGVNLPTLEGPRPPVQFWIHKSLLAGDLGQRLLGTAKTGLAVGNLLEWSREMMPAETFTAISKQEELPALKMAVDAAEDWYVLEFGEKPVAASLARAAR